MVAVARRDVRTRVVKRRKEWIARPLINRKDLARDAYRPGAVAPSRRGSGDIRFGPIHYCAIAGAAAAGKDMDPWIVRRGCPRAPWVSYHVKGIGAVAPAIKPIFVGRQRVTASLGRGSAQQSDVSGPCRDHSRQNQSGGQ